MSYHLIDLIQQLGHPRVLVIGDVILDRYVWGNAERISQEAPVILLRQDRTDVRLGGAANVANMLRGLDAEVAMAGAVGSDEDGQRLHALLETAGVDCSLLFVDASRPTTVKERLIGRAQNRHPHQILRVDRESREPLAATSAVPFSNAVVESLPGYDAVLVSDYGKGVCTPEVLSRVFAAGRQQKIPVIVDPGSSVDYLKYKGATAMTPNRLETRNATGREIKTGEDAFAAGHELCERLGLDHIFVTLDSDGIAVVRAGHSPQLLSTRKREVYDITGAGDMVLAMIGIGAATGVSPDDLGRLANVAGGLEVEEIGVVNVSREDILADLLVGHRSTDQKICQIDELQRHVAARRKLGQKLVLTNGCFDLLHFGHVSYIQQAAREGDYLVVALNSDEGIRRLNKAPGRPIIEQKHRASMLAALEAVDYVIIFEEATPHAIIDQLKPDLLVKGGTYRHNEIVGRDLVESYGGQVKALGVVPGVSTTEILARVRGERAMPNVWPLFGSDRKAG